jgi:hypothetical protein
MKFSYELLVNRLVFKNKSAVNIGENRETATIIRGAQVDIIGKELAPALATGKDSA